MNIRTVLAGAALAVVATAASAQTLMEQVKGTWQGRTEFCGDQVMTITGVDPGTGLIQGYQTCGRRNSKLVFAEEAVSGKSMVGKIEGNKLTIKGASSYANLTFQGGKLAGPTGVTGVNEVIVTYEKK